MYKASHNTCNKYLLKEHIYSKKLTVYRNDEVKCIIAGIPRGHKHLRLIMIFKDQVIILHEATVAAIVRAFVNIVLHPTKKAILFFKRNVSSVKKPGYADVQQIETCINEEDLLDIIDEVLEKAKTSQELNA